MRLYPTDVHNVFHYNEAGKCVGIEIRHKPTGFSSGVQATFDDAERALRDKLIPRVQS